MSKIIRLHIELCFPSEKMVKISNFSVKSYIWQQIIIGSRNYLFVTKPSPQTMLYHCHWNTYVNLEEELIRASQRTGIYVSVLAKWVFMAALSRGWNNRDHLCMRSANERRRYSVTSSLIGWAHTQNDPWNNITYAGSNFASEIRWRLPTNDTEPSSNCRHKLPRRPVTTDTPPTNLQPRENSFGELTRCGETLPSRLIVGVLSQIKPQR